MKHQEWLTALYEQRPYYRNFPTCRTLMNCLLTIVTRIMIWWENNKSHIDISCVNFPLWSSITQPSSPDFRTGTVHPSLFLRTLLPGLFFAAFLPPSTKRMFSSSGFWKALAVCFSFMTRVTPGHGLTVNCTQLYGVSLGDSALSRLHFRLSLQLTC